MEIEYLKKQLNYVQVSQLFLSKIVALPAPLSEPRSLSDPFVKNHIEPCLLNSHIEFDRGSRRRVANQSQGLKGVVKTSRHHNNFTLVNPTKSYLTETVFARGGGVGAETI